MAKHIVALTVAGALITGLASGPVAAQDHGYGRGGIDSMNRLEREQFERGYQAGREAERRRMDRSGSWDDGSRRRNETSDRFSSPEWDDASQGEVMERLDKASALLREALVQLRREPPGYRRDRVLEQARQALVQAQNAMTWMPGYGRGSASGGDDRRSGLEHGWGERASGGPRG